MHLDADALRWLEDVMRFDTFRLDRPHEIIVGRRVLFEAEGELSFLRLLRFGGPPRLGVQLLASPGAKRNQSFPSLRLRVKEFLARLSESQHVDGEFGSALVGLSDLLAVGAHLGQVTQRWNPRMRPYILFERAGHHIIDLRATVEYLNAAHSFVREVSEGGGTVLFVGTGAAARATLTEQAQALGMPYVTNKWLGGFLTNWRTTQTRLHRLGELEGVDLLAVSPTKKESVLLTRERDRLASRFGGLRILAQPPDALWVVDAARERLAVAEARRLHIPVVAMLDTDANPDLVDLKVPANPGSYACVELITRVLGQAISSTARQGSDKA